MNSLTGAIGLAAAICTIIGTGYVLIPKGSSSAQPRVRLQNVELRVHNDGASSPQVEVFLHNLGTRRSVITRANIHILHVTRLTLCTTQGELPLGGAYDVVLPAGTVAGQTLTVPMHEQLAADEAERLSFSLAVAGETSKNMPMEHPYIYMFQLKISLLHDLGEQPDDLGNVLIALPTLPASGEFFLTKNMIDASGRAYYIRAFGLDFYAENENCWRSNALALKSALALSGERSEDLTRAADGLVVAPRTVRGVEPWPRPSGGRACVGIVWRTLRDGDLICPSELSLLGEALTQITWFSWGGDAAVGEGSLVHAAYRDGRREEIFEPVELRLSNPSRCADGTRIYSRLETIRYSPQATRVTARDASRLTCDGSGAWQRAQGRSAMIGG